MLPTESGVTPTSETISAPLKTAPLWRGLEFIRRSPVLVGLVVAFAFLVHWPRLVQPGGSPDEEGELVISQHSLAHIVSHFHGAQNHPLYSILVHFAVEYLPLPDMQAARVPAMVAGVLIPVVFYLTHRRWVGREASILVAFLLVMADPLHHYMAAARGYTMLVLGVLMMNYLFLEGVQKGRAWPGVLYVLVSAATAYGHLWALVIVAAHAGFLVIEPLCRPQSSGRRGKFLIGLAAVAASIGLSALLYWPMREDVIAMATAHRERNLGFALILLDSLLQLARFQSWNLAAYLLLVPIVLEGLARKWRCQRPDRTVWFHVVVIVFAVTATLITQPGNFHSRFLMIVVPGGASLVAWGLSGYWTGQREWSSPILPRMATWLAGLALGVIVANASMSSSIPIYGAHTDDVGVDHGYYYRNLPKAIGSPLARNVFLVAVAIMVLRNSVKSWPKLPRGAVMHFQIYLWTALLVFSLPPLVLGPQYFKPRWVFEVHTVATAALWLLAWEYRFDDRALRALRYGLLLTLFVVVMWRLGGDDFWWEPVTPLRLAAIVPPVLVATALVRTTDPESYRE